MTHVIDILEGQFGWPGVVAWLPHLLFLVALTFFVTSVIRRLDLGPTGVAGMVGSAEGLTAVWRDADPEVEDAARIISAEGSPGLTVGSPAG